MPRGLVVVSPDRKDTPIREAFKGMTNVTEADVLELEAKHIDTVGKFAKIASDRDLTRDGFPPEYSIRLIAAFEVGPFADLLDYAKDLSAVATPAPAAPSAPVPKKGWFRRLWEWEPGKAAATTP